MKHLAALDLAVLLVYLEGIVAMGLWCGRKNRTAKDFMAAGGKIPGWAVGLSIFGTYVRASVFLRFRGKLMRQTGTALCSACRFPSRPGWR